MKNKYILILAVIFGLLSAYMIYDYLYKVEQSLSNVKYGQVVVAAGDIAAKTRITDEMLQVKKVPLEYIHSQAVLKKEDALGKLTVFPVVQGEQVLKNKIAGQNDVKNGLAYIVPVGKRAVTVAVDEVSGISGLIKPGDRVDVAATINIPDISGTKESPYSLIVLQDLTVLAVGKILEDKSDGKAQPDSKTLTLAVTVEQSRPLILASQKGSIRLMLRSPADDSIYNTTPFKAANFLQ